MKKQSSAESKMSNVERRNIAIQARFKHLFNVERLRFDDVKEKVAKEFYLAENTIMKVLKLDLESLPNS